LQLKIKHNQGEGNLANLSRHDETAPHKLKRGGTFCVLRELHTIVSD